MNNRELGERIKSYIAKGRLLQTRSPRGTTIPYRSWFAIDGKMASVVTSPDEAFATIRE